jgi:hypothetical protein
LAELCHCFNIFLFVLSKIIKETLFILAEYFQTFVPNTIENINLLPKSELSFKIYFIIDGTITFVQRKSFAKYFRADKHGKFVQTILIVNSDEDFDLSQSENFGSPLDDEGDISICEKHKDILIQKELLFEDGVRIPQTPNSKTV